jgi:hypothetical protein
VLTADRPIGRHPMVRYVSFWIVLFCRYESWLTRRARMEESWGRSDQLLTWVC